MRIGDCEMKCRDKSCNIKYQNWSLNLKNIDLIVKYVKGTVSPDFRTLLSNIFTKTKKFAKPFSPVHPGRIFKAKNW